MMRKACKAVRRWWREGSYLGAGILFYRCHPDGRCSILLFRRAIRPGRGRYSLTGGRLDTGEKGDFLAGAIRETFEECGRLVGPEEVRMSMKIWLPGFHWTTFLVEFKDDIRDLRLRKSEVSEAIEVDLTESFRLPLTRTMWWTLKRMQGYGWRRLGKSGHFTTG